MFEIAPFPTTSSSTSSRPKFNSTMAASSFNSTTTSQLPKPRTLRGRLPRRQKQRHRRFTITTSGSHPPLTFRILKKNRAQMTSPRKLTKNRNRQRAQRLNPTARKIQNQRLPLNQRFSQSCYTLRRKAYRWTSSSRLRPRKAFRRPMCHHQHHYRLGTPLPQLLMRCHRLQNAKEEIRPNWTDLTSTSQRDRSYWLLWPRCT